MNISDRIDDVLSITIEIKYLSQFLEFETQHHASRQDRERVQWTVSQISMLAARAEDRLLNIINHPGEAYEPSAEELAAARQATDWVPPAGHPLYRPSEAQSADDGYYENPGDSDEAQAA